VGFAPKIPLLSARLLELSKNQNKNSAPLPVFFHLRWVAKIALSVGVLAFIILIIELFMITDDKGMEYSRIILSDHLTYENLVPTIMVFGLLLTIVASIITWMVSLYGSFHIAGPLYRFSQNMKNVIEHPSNKPIAIRHTDLLQSEWQEFAASLSKLDQHYRQLRAACEEVEQALPPDAKADLSAVREAVARLKEVERHVQL